MFSITKKVKMKKKNIALVTLSIENLKKLKDNRSQKKH